MVEKGNGEREERPTEGEEGSEGRFSDKKCLYDSESVQR